MRRRRKVTAHDAKRRLIAKLNKLHYRSGMVELIITELREYAVARAFHNGASMDLLVEHENYAKRWDLARVEECVRRRSRLIGVTR